MTVARGVVCYGPLADFHFTPESRHEMSLLIFQSFEMTSMPFSAEACPRERQ